MNGSRLKIFASVYSVLILGFWYNSFISYGVLVSILAGHLPSPEKVSWYILFGGAVSLILITGKNLYCMWICPFGAMQDLIDKIGFKGFKRNPFINKYALKIPAFIAWFAAVSALLSGNPTIAGYEPFATLFCQIGTSVHWLLLPVVIFSGFFIRRFWCTYFCPVGYVFNRMAVYRRKLQTGAFKLKI
jgi:polyferredoxin